MSATGGNEPDAPGSALGAIILAGSLLAILAATILFAWYTWRMMDVSVGLGGLVIAGIGSLVGIALGVGLMRLCYFSSRHGYDDAAGRDRDD